MPYEDIRGVRLHYEALGEGPPCLLLPGALGTRTIGFCTAIGSAAAAWHTCDCARPARLWEVPVRPNASSRLIFTSRTCTTSRR